MKIGIMDSCYKIYPKDILFERLKEDGFDCIDYQGLVSVDSDFFKLPYPEFEKELKETRKRAENAGVDICQTHAPWKWPPCDETPESRRILSDNIVKAIYGTAVLGCKYMAVHHVCSYMNPPSDDFFDVNVEFLAPLTQEAKKYGVTLCLENLPFPYNDWMTPEGTLKMCDAVGNGMCICLDTGHSVVCGVQPAEAVRMFGSRLKILHVHDNDGRGDFHWLPYTGVVDWKAFTIALKEIGFDGCLSLEAGPKGSYPKHIYEMVLKELAASANAISGN